MEEKKMLLDEIPVELWCCGNCQMCQAVCTAHRQTRRGEHAPIRRVWLADVIRRGILNFDKSSVEMMYGGCTLCRLCREWCVSKQDVGKIMAVARADIFNLGLAPQSVLELDKKLESVKNITGEPLENRFSQIDLTRSKKNADVVYFVGCTSAYTRPEIPQAMQKIFNAADVSYTIMNEEYCCGLPAYELGLRKRATELAMHNAKIIRATKAKTIVASCPGCARALKLEYKEWNVPMEVEVIHHTEFLDQLLAKGRLKLRKSIDAVATYHDPCHLGRYMEIHDAPRKVLERIPKLKLVEMLRNREKALCCGAGGGYRITHPETAVRIEERVVNEATRADANLLVSACPTCKQSFQGAILDTEKLGLKDVAEVIVQAL